MGTSFGVGNEFSLMCIAGAALSSFLLLLLCSFSFAEFSAFSGRSTKIHHARCDDSSAPSCGYATHGLDDFNFFEVGGFEI
jgi:hypothetical protein